MMVLLVDTLLDMDRLVQEFERLAVFPDILENDGFVPQERRHVPRELALGSRVQLHRLVVMVGCGMGGRWDGCMGGRRNGWIGG
jgi:hypothetical protein